MSRDFISGLRARKPDVQAAFVSEYGPRVYAFILDVVGDTDDADELTADVFLKAFKAIRGYDSSKASLASPQRGDLAPAPPEAAYQPA